MIFRFSAAILGVATVLGLAGLASAWQVPSGKAQDVPKDATAPADTKKGDTADNKDAPKLERATFGGGCFWCLEAFFESVTGVKTVVSGYAGGDNSARPSYEMVCTGLTGHAEVVQIAFDPAVVTYDDLLEIFWICHDPTTLNRQGPDAGTQYRSIILAQDPAQKAAAEKSRAVAANLYPAPITTEIVPLVRFFPAEKYHQGYYRKNTRAEYCQVYITPKLRALKVKLNAKAAAKAKAKSAH